MVMDRRQLAKAIDVGTKSTLNAFEIAKNIRALGEEIADDDPKGKMFKNVQLNNSIIFNVMERSEDGLKFSVDTLLYFPYNHDNIYEGGDSVLFSDPVFWEKVNLKTGLEIDNEEGMEIFNYDKKIVEMLKTIPTLDPFLLKNKAIRLGIDEYIHEDYFNISLDEWNKIQAPIRQKIKALVEKALGVGGDGASTPRLSQIESHITKFLNKIWEARDIDGIEDFVLSLDIKPEKAPELFFAWKALCYYEVQFRGLMRDLRQFYSWVGNPVDSTPTDIAQMPFDDREELMRSLRQLRYTLRNGFKRV